MAEEDEKQSYVKTQSFGMVLGGMISVALALNGFMWSNIQGLRETNLQVRGEIQHLMASTLPLDRAVTRDAAEAIEHQIEAQDIRLRGTIDDLQDAAESADERLRVMVIQNTKTLLVMCAKSKIEGLDCTK